MTQTGLSSFYIQIEGVFRMSVSSTLPLVDLTQGYPRSPNQELGGFVLLPRIIDKCRALLTEKNGEYNYNCPLDRRFFDFTGIDADAFKAEVALGKTDEELLVWVQQHTSQLTSETVSNWSYSNRWRRPDTPQMIHHFENMRKDFAPDNYLIETWFQLLDADEKRF
jgi:hypothetical protein